MGMRRRTRLGWAGHWVEDMCCYDTNINYSTVEEKKKIWCSKKLSYDFGGRRFGGRRFCTLYKKVSFISEFLMPDPTTTDTINLIKILIGYLASTHFKYRTMHKLMEKIRTLFKDFAFTEQTIADTGLS